MSAFHFVEVHKNNIVAGDVIFHNGHERTVCNSNLKSDSFMGLTIFGDSYRLGYKPVLKGIYNNPLNNKGN